MNLLITGGLGTIGSEIVRVAGQDPDIRTVTLSRTPQPDRPLHVVGSVLDEGLLSDVISRHEISHIVHAAGARTSLCEHEPLQGFESNVLATDRLFRAAKGERTVRHVVFLSTAAVYGKVEHLVNEAFPIAPSTNYAVTKAAAEIAAKGHAQEADFSLTILRPGFVIGEKSTSKLNGWIQEAKKNAEVQIHFANRFHLHWAPDLAAAILGLCQTSSSGTFHPPGSTHTITEFAAELQKTAAEFQFPATISTSIDPSLNLPEHLDWTRFRETVGRYNTTDLATMIRRVMGRR